MTNRSRTGTCSNCTPEGHKPPAAAVRGRFWIEDRGLASAEDLWGADAVMPDPESDLADRSTEPNRSPVGSPLPDTMPAPAGPPRPGATDLRADAMKPWLTPILCLLLTIPAAQAADNLKAFPPAEAGQVRYVLEVPPQEDESAFKVQLVVGKTVLVDAHNRYFFGGQIQEETIQGWGFPRFVVSAQEVAIVRVH